MCVCVNSGKRLSDGDDLKDSLKQEQERVKDLLKNLRSVIGKHKRARTGNDRGEAADQVARRQAEALSVRDGACALVVLRTGDEVAGSS